MGHLVIPCVLGRNGLTYRKREGDGCTPFGRFELLAFFIRRDRVQRPRTRISIAPTRPADGWCDEQGHRRYNRPVSLPFTGRSEELWREDQLYDLVGVLDYNYSRRVQGRGSAIFFHVMAKGGQATEGCVAIKLEDFRRLLPQLAAHTTLIIG